MNINKFVRDCADFMKESEKVTKEQKKQEKAMGLKDLPESLIRAAEKILSESAPDDPEIEKWINANKDRFRKEYGDKWEEVLYGKAWDMYNSKKECTKTAGKGLNEEIGQELSIGDVLKFNMPQLRDAYGRVFNVTAWKTWTVVSKDSMYYGIECDGEMRAVPRYSVDSPSVFGKFFQVVAHVDVTAPMVTEDKKKDLNSASNYVDILSKHKLASGSVQYQGSDRSVNLARAEKAATSAQIKEGLSTGSFTEAEATAIGNQLGIDFDKIPLDQFLKGLNHELEHSDVVNSDEEVGKIAKAHLDEIPDYYEGLSNMEKQYKVKTIDEQFNPKDFPGFNKLKQTADIRGHVVAYRRERGGEDKELAVIDPADKFETSIPYEIVYDGRKKLKEEMIQKAVFPGSVHITTYGGRPGTYINPEMKHNDMGVYSIASADLGNLLVGLDKLTRNGLFRVIGTRISPPQKEVKEIVKFSDAVKAFETMVAAYGKRAYPDLREDKLSYPPIPKDAKLFLTKSYGYEEPVEIHNWEWSTTFGKWGAVVSFKSGEKVYTFPKPGMNESVDRKIQELYSPGDRFDGILDLKGQKVGPHDLEAQDFVPGTKLYFIGYDQPVSSKRKYEFSPGQTHVVVSNSKINGIELTDGFKIYKVDYSDMTMMWFRGYIRLGRGQIKNYVF